MKLPTCELCHKPILPEELAMYRNGRPAQHRRHYSQDYTPLQRGRWSELIAAERELAEGSGGLAAKSLIRLPDGPPRRGYKPDLDAIERRRVPGAKRRRAKE